MRSPVREVLVATVLPLAVALLAAGAARAQGSYDLVLRGGQVVDGSGAASFVADVAVRDGRIVALGDLAGASARRLIDARGKVVAPGFIDLHSHADDSRPGGLRSDDPVRRAAPNLVTQGVTTVVVNQDGRSPWPILAQRWFMEGNGIGPNVVLLVGHGTLRGRAMAGRVERPATPAEIRSMRRLLRQALDEGAAGLSAGLEYSPGRWSTTYELVELVEEVAARGGVFISHQRSEGEDPMWSFPGRNGQPPGLLEAVRETIEIGERTGATVVATHIKSKGARSWGTSAEVIRLIQAARDRGVAIFADTYPYTTSGTDGATRLIPEWVAEGEAPGLAAMADFRALVLAALADSATASVLRHDIAHEIDRRGGPDHLVVIESPVGRHVGRTLAELAAARRTTAVEMAITLQLEGDTTERGGVRIRGSSMREDDVEAYVRQPWTAIASDAGIALPGDGPVHPRLYGTFPRTLRSLVLDRGALGLEEAIRSMTSLPAQIIGLEDRGLIRPGHAADLVVIDLGRVADTATFQDSHRYAAGIDHVLVAGVPVVVGGEPTWRLPGQVLVPAPARVTAP